MASKPQPAATVRLTAPSGTHVTVSAESAEAYKAKGYKGVPGRPAKADGDK